MKLKTPLVVVALILLAALALFAAAPLYSFQALQQAAERGDRAKIETLVDFPALRANLKDQLSARVIQAMNKDKGLNGSPFGTLGALLVPTVVEQLVKSVVTPEGIAAIAVSGRAPLSDLRPGKSALPPPDEAAPVPPPAELAPVKVKKQFRSKFAYESFNAFRTTYSDGIHPPLVWVMERRGLGWKLTRIDLPPA